MQLAEVVHNPRYFQILVLTSGEYQKEERKKFISKVAEYHLFLAAACKMCSIDPEIDIKNDIIEKARQKIFTSPEPAEIANAIAALARIKEIDLAKALFFWLGYETAATVLNEIAGFQYAPYQELEQVFRELFFDPKQSHQESLINIEYNFDLYFDETTVQKQRLKTNLAQLKANASYPKLRRLFDLMDYFEINPKKYHYDLIINYSPNFDNAHYYFSEMQLQGLEPSENTFNAFLNKAEKWERANSIFEDMQKRFPIKPNNTKQYLIAYSILIKYASPQQAQQLLQEAKGKEIQIDQKMYEDVFYKQKDQTFAEAKSFVEEMKKENLKPNEISYNTLINKAQTFEQAKPIFEEMQKNLPLTSNNLPQYLISYSTLINKAQTFEQAKPIFDEMKKENLTPNEISYSTLINKAQTFEQAKPIFEEMQKNLPLTSNNLPQYLISYSTLINKAQTFEQAKPIFEEMQKNLPLSSDNLPQYLISYSTLINKAQTFEQAKPIFDEMKKENLKPNEISYSTLINKAQTFEQQKPFYLDFLKLFPLKKGNFKTEKNYNYLFFALFKKIKNKNDWDFVKTEIYRLGVNFDEKYHTQAQSFYESLQTKYGR